jgi:hypothetical protein
VRELQIEEHMIILQSDFMPFCFFNMISEMCDERENTFSLEIITTHAETLGAHLHRLQRDGDD